MTESTEQMQMPSTAEPHQDVGSLAHGGVHFLGTLAQSVGLIGPTASAGILLGLMFGTVGPLGWVTWIIGALALTCVALAIMSLARRFLTTGGLYPLAAKAAGSALGFATAFGALLWVIIAAPAIGIVCGLYVSNFLALPAIGIHQSTLEIVCLAVATTVACAWISYRGVQLSVRFLLGAELLTMAMIFVLMIVTLFKHHGGIVDHQQLAFGHASFSLILKGMVLMVFSMGGFESATVLGQEAVNGRRTIPRSVIGSVIVAALFLAVCQYVTVLGFAHTGLDLATSSSVLGSLCSIDGIKWFAYVIDFLLCIAITSNQVAIFNGGSRMLFTIPRETAAAPVLLRIGKHKTPVAGLLAMVAANVGVLVVLGLSDSNTVNTVDYLNTLAGYGAVLMYAFTCAAAVVLLAKLGKYLAIVPCVLAIALLTYALYTNFHPFPTGPSKYYAWLFFVMCVVAAVGYLVLRTRRPSAFTGLSSDFDTALGNETATLDQVAV